MKVREFRSDLKEMWEIVNYNEDEYSFIESITIIPLFLLIFIAFLVFVKIKKIKKRK